MIVGTAGHIDHGKTTLVKALTGVDTDRLPEEKKRGISIELGYAFLDTPAGERIGFIDVPGHERLVRTMISGATGMDRALLLVAADDGVMPQTREHLAVLSLLDVRRGAVVVTKADRVDAARVATVCDEAAARPRRPFRWSHWAHLRRSRLRAARRSAPHPPADRPRVAQPGLPLEPRRKVAPLARLTAWSGSQRAPAWRLRSRASLFEGHDRQ